MPSNTNSILAELLKQLPAHCYINIDNKFLGRGVEALPLFNPAFSSLSIECQDRVEILYH